MWGAIDRDSRPIKGRKKQGVSLRNQELGFTVFANQRPEIGPPAYRCRSGTPSSHDFSLLSLRKEKMKGRLKEQSGSCQRLGQFLQQPVVFTAGEGDGTAPDTLSDCLQRCGQRRRRSGCREGGCVCARQPGYTSTLSAAGRCPRPLRARLHPDSAFRPSPSTRPTVQVPRHVNLLLF